jgi:hypothetical protein
MAQSGKAATKGFGTEGNEGNEEKRTSRKILAEMIDFHL